jgi:purine-binding chemotaxis protein CheW
MAEPAAASSGGRRFLTFWLDRRFYALAAEDVVEVIHTPQVTRVPQAPKALVGIANLRGTVLPLASLRGLLGMSGEDEGSRAIVLDGQSPAAFAVDRIESLVDVDRIELRQAELAAEPGEKLVGAFPIEGAGAVKILDVKALLDDAFAQRAGRKTKAPMRSAATAVHDEHRFVERETLVTFDVAGQEYALALADVQEIVPPSNTIAAVPRAEALVVGVMPHRDRLLPLLSLRGLLGFAPDAAPDGREKVFVTMAGGAAVGLLADRARTILAADKERIEPVPVVLAARSGGEARIKAIYRGDDGKRLVSILAPDQLFREDIMKRLATERVAPMSQAAPTAAVEWQFLVFRLGDDEFGLPIEAVDEVARVPDQITRVPKTPKFLEGIVNLRGQVLPVIDQRRRFDMPKLEANENRRLIVLRTERHRAGVIVDSVSQVLRSSDDAIAPPPDLTGDITRLVHGVINLESERRIVLLLDPAELLTRAEHGLLDAFGGKSKA